MPHVKHEAIPPGVKFLFNGHLQLHDAQIGRQMPAGLGHMLHQPLPDLLTELRLLLPWDGQQVLPGLDML